MFKQVNSLELFNLMQRKYSNKARDEICIVDCREHLLYLQKHIKNSISIPLSTSSDLNTIISQIPIPAQKEILNYDRLNKFHLIILLYGSEDKETSLPWAKQLASYFRRLNFSSTTLGESFEDFIAQYPFLQAKDNEDENIIIINNSPNEFTDIEEEFGSSKEDIGYPTELIKNFLYIGKLNHAKSEKVINDINITHIVCIHDENVEPSNSFDNIKYFNIAVNDTPNSPISSYFDDFLDFMKTIHSENGDKCLIHCNYGISRSATFAILFLMIHFNYTLNYSERFITSQHIDAYPNKGFYASLQSVEKTYFQPPPKIQLGNNTPAYKLVPREGVNRVSPFRHTGSELTCLINNNEAPSWVPDQNTDKCHGCGIVFTFINRRHHCRHCGNIYCGVCSNYQIAIPRLKFNKPVRTCLQCYTYLTKPHLAATVQES